MVKLEDKLIELGKSFASPPSSEEELCSLLDVVDSFLSKVDQSPSKSMWTALQPLMKALAVKELLRHHNTDVKVAVASCVSEITRITAPDAPYEDGLMKEIFQMIVGAFEGLDDMSSRSFKKRVSILETVAKVRSCVVMLDLECDALIFDMFNHFLKTVRSGHSKSVLSSMETIMALVIEESEDISLELLSFLLDNLRKDNKDLLPIAQKLAANVMGKCAKRIRPCLVELLQSTHASLNAYDDIVASICENSDPLDQKETHGSAEVPEDDSKLSERTVSDELPQVSAKVEPEVGASDTSPIAATSNGTRQVGDVDSMEQPSSPKQKSERSRRSGLSKKSVSDRAESDKLEPVAVKYDTPPNLKKRKGRKTNSSLHLTDASRIESDKGAPVAASRRKNRSTEASSSKVDASAKEIKLAAGKNESDNPTSAASPTRNESPPNSARNRRGRSHGSKTAAKSVDVDTVADRPASAVPQDSSGNSQTDNEEMPSNDDDSKDPENADDGEVPVTSKVKPQRKASKKRWKRKVAEQESSGRKQKSNIKQQKEEDTSGKETDGEPSLKAMQSSRRSLKTPSTGQTPLNDSAKPKSRRKRALGTKYVNEGKELVDSLVGMKIRVWWPKDETFYDGVVASYDPATKKHKIAYTDGEIEHLLLKDEIYEFPVSDSMNDGVKTKAKGSDSQTPQMKKAKLGSNSVSKQDKSHTQSKSKSGKESSSKDIAKPRGRPSSETSKPRKLSYDDTPGSSKKSKGTSPSIDKSKIPKSSENEAKVETPKSSSKKEEPSKSTRKSKNETPKATGAKSKDDDDDNSKLRDSTTRTPTTKPKVKSTPNIGGDSKKNGMSSKGKAKVGESESTPSISEGEVAIGAKKRKRKGRK